MSSYNSLKFHVQVVDLTHVDYEGIESCLSMCKIYSHWRLDSLSRFIRVDIGVWDLEGP